MFFGVPTTQSIVFSEPPLSRKKTRQGVLSLDSISDGAISERAPKAGVVDILLPQAFFLKRQVIAPTRGKKALHAIAALDLQRQTPFEASDVYWVLSDPKPAKTGFVSYQWVLKQSELIAFKSRLAKIGARLRCVYIEGIDRLDPVADFSSEVAPLGRTWRRLNGALLIVIVGCALFSWLYPAWSLRPQLEDLRQVQSDLTQKAVSLRTQIEELKKEEEEKSQFLDLALGSPRLSKTLAGLTEALEDKVWLKSVTFRPHEVGISGEIQGSAAELVLDLSSNTLFSEVALSGAVSRTASNSELFDISIRPGGFR